MDTNLKHLMGKVSVIMRIKDLKLCEKEEIIMKLSTYEVMVRLFLKSMLLLRKNLKEN
jgi:hypothetical protein